MVDAIWGVLLEPACITTRVRHVKGKVLLCVHPAFRVPHLSAQGHSLQTAPSNLSRPPARLYLLQGTTPGDWEAITPLVANTSSPVFDHAAQLHLTSPEAWGRVCGPSAALVFRVWRRARYSWWDDPQTLAASDQPCDATSGGDKVAGVAAAAAAAAGSRLGDKLIGSAMVGLEVLLGSFGSGEGPGLREIDGWYHVLDDLRRPQGQIKVCAWCESAWVGCAQKFRGRVLAVPMLAPLLR